MQKALSLFDTTIGKKAVMAVTGLILLGFLLGHMLGNMQVYLGPAQLDSYAEHLRALGPWVGRERKCEAAEGSDEGREGGEHHRDEGA